MCVAIGMYPSIDWDRHVTLTVDGRTVEGLIHAWQPEEGWLTLGGSAYWLHQIDAGSTRCGLDLHDLAWRFGWRGGRATR
jgi:hypothetical protein